jgi:LPXTG-motif cell wall-anchored protein
MKKENMLKKIIAGVAAGVTVVMLAAVPSLAGTFGELETLNPSGGTNSSNGIKIDYAAGSVQVTRNSYQQVFPAQSDVDIDPGYFCGTGILPNPDTQGCVSSAFIVALASDGNYNVDPIVVGAPDPYMGLPPDAIGDYWDTITSSSTVAADGSGTISSTLTYTFDWCNSGCSGTLTLDVDLSYTYPNQYFTVDTATSWQNISGSPAENDWYARIYFYEDATLSGLDEGNQFSTTDAAGNKLVGVIRPDGTALEGVRSYPTYDIHTYAGEYSCPVDSSSTDCTDVFGATGWMLSVSNLPDSIDPAEGVDNGFSVQAGNGSYFVQDDLVLAPATSKFDLLFMACEVGVAPGDCIEAGGYVAPADPALANTGVNGASAAALAAGTFALVMVGAALMVVRRRRNA